MYGISAVLSRLQRASPSATRIPRPQPITKPPSASLNVNQPARQSRSRLSQNVPRMSESGGSRKRCTSRPRTRPLPGGDPEHEDARPGPRPAGASQPLLRGDQRFLDAFLLVVEAAGHPSRRTDWISSAKRALLPSGQRPLAGRSTSTTPAMRAWTRRHHDDVRGEEHGLGDRVRVEDDRRLGLSQIRSSSPFRRSRVISSSAPNGSSISRRSGENESARAIETRCCIPPESCHGWCFSKPWSSTSSSISCTRPRRRRRSQPDISSGSSTLRATVRQSYSTASWKTIP